MSIQRVELDRIHHAFVDPMQALGLLVCPLASDDMLDPIGAHWESATMGDGVVVDVLTGDASLHQVSWDKAMDALARRGFELVPDDWGAPLLHATTPEGRSVYSFQGSDPMSSDDSFEAMRRSLDDLWDAVVSAERLGL